MPHPDVDPRTREPDPWTAFVRRAEALWDARRYELILELAGRHLAEHGDSADLQGWISFAAVASGRAAEGIAAAEARVAADPSSAPAHADHGHLLRCTGDDAAAEAAFRRALEIDPRNAQCRGRLADLLLDGGEPAEGLAEARRALEIDPVQIHAYIAAVRGCIEIESLAEAREMLDAAPPALVGTARFHALRGDLLRYDRKTTSAAAAAEAFHEALRLDPQWVAARERGLYAALESRPIYPVAAALVRFRRWFGRAAELVWFVLAVLASVSPGAVRLPALAAVVVARHFAIDAHVAAYWATFRRDDLRRLAGDYRLTRRTVSGMWRLAVGLSSVALGIVAAHRSAEYAAAVAAVVFGQALDVGLLQKQALRHAEGTLSTRRFGLVALGVIAGLSYVFLRIGAARR